MTRSAADIDKIIEQEHALVFVAFDESEAFALGLRLRDLAAAQALPVVIEIRLWDRLLFYAALQGSSGSNADWVRRKLNTVKMFHKSTYRMVLEQGRPDRTFHPDSGLSNADYVLAGGGFPLTVAGAGVIGAIGVSGLPQRQDHEVIVAALSAHLGKDAAKLALPAES